MVSNQLLLSSLVVVVTPSFANLSSPRSPLEQRKVASHPLTPPVVAQQGKVAGNAPLPSLFAQGRRSIFAKDRHRSLLLKSLVSIASERNNIQVRKISKFPYMKSLVFLVIANG